MEPTGGTTSTKTTSSPTEAASVSRLSQGVQAGLRRRPQCPVIQTGHWMKFYPKESDNDTRNSSISYLEPDDIKDKTEEIKNEVFKRKTTTPTQLIHH